MKITHNTETWFGGDFELYEYFNNQFKLNTIGNFKVPSSTARRFNNLATQADINKIIGNLGNLMISVMTAAPKSKKLRQIPFNWTEVDTQDELKEAVCEMIQHAIYNKQIMERLNASSISTPNFTVSQDTVGWLLTADIIGQFARTAITNSGIEDYEWLTEDELYMETASGNIKIIGRASLDTIKELSI